MVCHRRSFSQIVIGDRDICRYEADTFTVTVAARADWFDSDLAIGIAFCIYGPGRSGLSQEDRHEHRYVFVVRPWIVADGDIDDRFAKMIEIMPGRFAFRPH